VEASNADEEVDSTMTFSRRERRVAGSRRGRALAAVLLIVLSAVAGAQVVEEGFLVVRKVPNPVRVAVPMFVATNALPEGDQALTILTDKMRDVISFTGLFELIDPAAYPQPMVGAGGDDLDGYALIRAQFLIRGAVAYKGDGKYQAVIRCYDVKTKQQVLAKTYTASGDLFNRMVLRFVDDLLGWIHPSSGRGALDARIAFVTDRSRRNEIHAMDTDGMHDQPITRNGTLNLFPAWAPNGRFLIYTGYQARNPDIYLANLDEGKEWKLFGERGTNIAGEFSKDGRNISFSREGSNGNMDIYTIGTDGKGLTRLTRSPAIEISPTWSPDGKLMAFVSDRTGTPQIYLLDLAAGVESPDNPAVRVTQEGSYNTEPSWSPDGRYIAFSGRVNGQFDLFIVNMSGAAPEITKRITQTPENEEHPRWSPDSRFLIFQSTKYGNYDIYIMSIYGHEPKRITTGAANERQPTWSPRI
jgi:TolB protein